MSDNEGCANYAADLFELTKGYANYAEAAIDRYSAMSSKRWG